MKKGFTLIELLVVIAIIAILAAILFPVFAQAREKARAITCVSNEKQMGLALLQYLQDNDEQFPFLQYYYMGTLPAGSAGIYPIDWTDAVYPYVKNGQTVQGTANVVIHNGQGGVWACPSFPTPTVAEYGINWELARDGGGTWEAQTGNDTNYSLQTVNDASVPSPADTVMVVEHGQPAAGFISGYFDPSESSWTTPGSLAVVNGAVTGTDQHLELNYDLDCALNSSSAICANWNDATPGQMPRSRHTNTSNALFVDGHVKAIHRGSFLWYNNIYIQGVFESWYGQVNGGTPPAF